MTGGAADTLTRAAGWLLTRAWLVVALLVPLVLVAGGGTPDAAVAVLVCALAVVAANGPRLAPLPTRIVPGGRGRPVLAPPSPTSRIPDPVRHPLRPRAPGLV